MSEKTKCPYCARMLKGAEVTEKQGRWILLTRNLGIDIQD